MRLCRAHGRRALRRFSSHHPCEWWVQQPRLEAGGERTEAGQGAEGFADREHRRRSARQQAEHADRGNHLYTGRAHCLHQLAMLQLTYRTRHIRIQIHRSTVIIFAIVYNWNIHHYICKQNKRSIHKKLSKEKESIWENKKNCLNYSYKNTKTIFIKMARNKKSRRVEILLSTNI